LLTERQAPGGDTGRIAGVTDSGDGPKIDTRPSHIRLSLDSAAHGEQMNSAHTRARGVLSLIALAAGAWMSTATADAGNPGDVVAASRRLRERAAALEPPQHVTPGLTRDVGAIAIVEHDGTDYSKLEPDGTPNYAARATVARRFFETHGDRYDFLLVFTNFAFDTDGAVAFHGLVRNDVTGIGMPVVNNGPLFGSPGRLKGYIDMALVDQFRHAPFSDQPGTPGFDDAVNVIVHEVGHQWLASVRYRNGAGVDSEDLLGIDGSHWSYLLDSDASLMYGSDWTAEGAGVFRASRVRLGYSALDLYLMGLLESTRVPPFTLLRSPGVSPAQLPVEGATVTGLPEAIAIGQVIQAESSRVPDHLASQKDFRMGVLLLVAPGVEPSAEDLELVDRMRTAFASRFFALTRGVAFVDTTLAEEPLPEPLPAPDVDGALAWLRGRQSPDGRWEDVSGTGVRDTSAALETLREAATLDVGYTRGQAWLASAEAANVDFLARRARARAPAIPPAERVAIAAALFAAQNPDGGFGAASGYESDGLDTALALSALRDLQVPADSRIRRAFVALGALQELSGGWALVPGREPSTVATALVLSALQAWADEPDAAVLLPPALAALLSRQNDDGGFGESPSTAHGTALALLALDRSGAPGAVIDDAIAWLQRTQAQDRSWNGRAYETALAIRALKGRTAPNLLLRQDDLTLTPAQAEEGEVVTVSARVRNDGRLASTATLLRLYDGAPVAENAVGDVSVPAIEPGANALVTVPFDTQGRAGTRLLTAVVDPDRTLSEVREDDNAASRSLVVEGPQPDLSVAATDIVVTPYPPEVGETMTVAVTVRNRGDREAPASEVRVVRTAGSASVGIGQAMLGPLATGASATVTVSWTAPPLPGSLSLTATADAQFAVAESDETNNTASIAIEVTPPGGNGPDLEVPLVTADPPVLSTIPQSFAVRAVVRNLGRDPLTSTVAIFDGTLETGTLLVEQPIALDGRSSQVITVPFQVVSPGDRTLTAVVDRAGTVSEPNESNNRASVSIDDPGNTFDLAVTAAVPNAPQVVVGEAVTVTATVTNRGTAFVGNIPVVLAVDGPPFMEFDRVQVALGAGQSTDVTLSWTSAFTGTPVPLVVVADAFDLLDELDEANNRWPVPVDVAPSELGNLRVASADLTFVPDPPLQGSDAALAVIVRNPSPVAVGPFLVRFYLGDPQAGGTVIDETTIPGLDGASSTTASIVWSPVDVQGHQGLWVVADAGGAIEEYDESDNVAFRPFQAVSLPDLAISSAELVVDPAFPHAGEIAAVRVTVRNVGDRLAASGTLLRVFEGEPASGALIDEIPIPALAPGASVVLTAQWTVATEGEYLVSALADADDQLPEANEGNNLSRRAVIVQDADTYLTAAYFSPDGDGVLDETTVVYRAENTPSVTLQVSDARGQLVRTLAEEVPAQGSAAWDGRDDRGRLLWDGRYTITVRAASGAVRGRTAVVLDTNRGSIHEAAGTGMVSLRAFSGVPYSVAGLAWLPSEDAVLTVIPFGEGGVPRGLVRWDLDGARSYVSQDDWYENAGFTGHDAVSPDGREVLMVKDGRLFAVDLNDGTRRLVLEQASGGALWSPDGLRIYSGDTVYLRDGTAEAYVGFGWQWSPSGEYLYGGLTVQRRDGSDVRELTPPVALPQSSEVGAACFVGTHWRGDDRIVLNTGRIVLVSGEGGPQPQCFADRAFVLDPHTDTSVEATALRGLPASTDWSPDGSRLLFQAAPFSGWESQVAREFEGQPVRLWTERFFAAPRRTVAFGCQDQHCDTPSGLGVLVNLRNLTADLGAVPLPGGYGILLRGTATDAHLDRYELDYALASAPGAWTPIGPSSDFPVVDGLLGTWVPATPGTYLVRLRVWDRAGTVRTATRVIAWNHTPPIGNITQSEYIISPTGDGVKDTVRFEFLVHEPIRLDVRVVGPEPPAGSTATPLTVRQFSFDLDDIGEPPLVEWDGRDQNGAVVRDGRYAVYLNQIPFRVDVDATPPEIGWSHQAVGKGGRQGVSSFGEVRTGSTCDLAVVAVEDVIVAGRYHVVDKNLLDWGVGEFRRTEQVFVATGEYEPDGTPVVLRENGRPVDVDGGFERSMYGTLLARDRAGNESTLEPTPLDELLFVTGARAKPDCTVPAGSELAPTQLIKPLNPPHDVNALPLKARLFFDSGPNDTVGVARFEFQNASGGWMTGPQGFDPYVDVDLPALGLEVGKTYLGRLADEDGLTTPDFRFSLCTESMTLTVLPDPVQGQPSLTRYRARLESTVSAPLVRLELRVVDPTTNFDLLVPLVRVGPTTFEAVVTVPPSNCDATPEPGAPFPRPLQFQVIAVRQDGRSLHATPEERACFGLEQAVFGCADDIVVGVESTSCATAVADRAVLKVFARSLEPNVPVTVHLGGTPLPGMPYSIGDTHCVPPDGLPEWYCDGRSFTVDLSSLPEGTVPIRADLGQVADDEADLLVDRSGPAVTMSKPSEGEGVCVETHEFREVVRLDFQVEDAVDRVEVTSSSFRYGDGPWQKLCLGYPAVNNVGEPIWVSQCAPPVYPLDTGDPFSRYWVVNGLPDGEYTIRFELCDRYGNRSAFERRLTVFRGVAAVAITQVDSPRFSPNADGLADSVTATVRLPQPLRMTVQVRAGSQNGPVVRTLADDQTFPAGDRPFTWDGLDALGVRAAEGPYAIVVRGGNACGASDTRHTMVVLDVTPPAVDITSPTPGASIDAATDVVGRAHDASFQSFSLSWGVGASPTAWTGIASGNYPVGSASAVGLLGTFQPPPLEGTYTLRLRGRDRAANEAEVTVAVEVGAPVYLDRLAVEPRAFSPNGDGRKDATTIEYALLAAAEVTLEVRDASNAVVRRFANGVAHAAGAYAIAWDGRNDVGGAVPDDNLRVHISLVRPTLPSVIQEASTALLLDTTPPTVSLTAPVAGTDVTNATIVHGSIEDAHLVEYVLEAIRPFAPAVELARGNQSVVDADLAGLSAISDGPIEVRARAEDSAGNMAEALVPVTIDSVAPLALLVSPAAGDVLDRGATPVAVTGSATDDRLERWDLAFGPGGQPAYFVPIASGTEGGTGLALGNWAVAALPDGTYTLRLVARDRAGQESTSRAIVVLDSVEPIAVIGVPAEGAALNAVGPIDGTASDANLEGWTVEAAPGDAATAFQWSPLSEGTTSVTSGSLGEWTPLPPDGMHTLRLTARDRAGHVSRTLRTVTIDTAPPLLPTGLVGTVQPAGATTGDVVLTWLASASTDVAGYRVTRVGGADLAALVPGLTYTDGGVVEGTHSYEVRAVDLAGNASGPATVTIRLDVTPPVVSLFAPAAGARVSGAVNVQGTAFSAGDFSEYRVLVGAGAAPTDWTLVRRSTVPVTAGLLATWTALVDGPHVLALEAEDTSGNRARTTVDVFVDLVPPPAPEIDSVQPPQAGPTTTLVVTWTLLTEPDVAGYLVYRDGRLANAPGVVIGDLRPFLVDGPQYADVDLPDGERCYRLVAMDQAGNMSAPSNEKCAMLDNRIPHAVLISPPAGTRFGFPIQLLATIADTDAFVRFQIRSPSDSTWAPVGLDDLLPPYEQMLDPEPLVPGNYFVRALACDHGPGPDERCDANATEVPVVYGDTTAPEPPANLMGTADGEAVTLSWTASPEPDVVGYRVYRDGEPLTPEAEPSTTHGDTRAEPGVYEYAVTAVDGDDNEGAPAMVEVELYRPSLAHLVPPQRDGPTVALAGDGARGTGTVEIVRDGAVVAQVAAAAGTFTVGSVPLPAGPAVFTARERDGVGRASLPSEPVVLIGIDPPEPITGFTGGAIGLQAWLSWDAAASNVVSGYDLHRDGQHLTAPVLEQSASGVVASSGLPGHDPYRAYDSNPQTSWIPTLADASPCWTVSFHEPLRLVHTVTLHFGGLGGPAPAPAHRVVADWNGYEVTLATSAGGDSPEVTHMLALPFATPLVRVVLGPSSPVGLAEVQVLHLPVVPRITPQFTELVANGVHSYQVAAIDRFGSRGPAATVDVPVGDVEVPPVPQGLAASVAGSDVTLTWQPVTAPDLAEYLVRRDGATIGTAPGATYLDAARPNGTYTYTVRTRDAAGNESADSDPAVAVVAVEPPVAPALAAATPPEGGVALSWSHPGAPHFVVRRSLVAGGPYATVTRTAAVASFLDEDVRPGEPVYYVIQAEDASGNLSVPSNEASALPVMPRPVLLRPTDTAHPLSLVANQSAIGGRAFPDALVAVTVGGELRGVASAGRAYEPIETVALPPLSRLVAVSRDARVVVFYVEDPATGTTAVRWNDLVTAATGTLPQGAAVQAFSPDERRLAYYVWTCSEVGCTESWSVLDLDTGAVSPIDAAGRDLNEVAWSPVANEIAISSADGTASHLEVVDLSTGVRRTLSVWSDGEYGIRWSPDGTEIAVVRQSAVDGARIAVFPALGGPAQVAPEGVAWGAAEWDPLERRIAFLGVWPARIRSWDLVTGAVEDLADGRQPRFSRTGRYFSYAHSTQPDGGGVWTNAVRVRDRSTGVEHELPRASSEGGFVDPVFHLWTRGEYLGLATDTRFELLPTFDGAFRVPVVPLDPGANVVDAEAIHVQTGSISDPSDPLTITTPPSAYPDLAVSPADLASYPALPLVGQPMALAARVRNLGLAAAANVSVRLQLRGPAGTLLDQAVTLSSIPAGGSAVASAYWTAPAPGTYLLRAEADADTTISESNEANNAGESGIHVTATPELVVTASTDHPSYPAHAPVRVHVDLANGGAPWSGTVLTDIVTAAGAPVAALGASSLSVGYGQAAALDLQWNTAAHLAGGYTVRVRALVGDTVTANDDAAFAVEPHSAAWARVTPADPTIPLGSAAQLAARIENRGANTVLDGMSARVRVVAAGGATLFEATGPVPALPPGAGWDGSFAWSPAASVGLHAVRLEALAADGSPLATAEAALEVQAAAGLQGTIALAPAHVLAGDSVSALATVTNPGPAPITGQAFTMEVWNETTVLASVPFTLDIPGGATRTATVTLPTSALPFGAHPVFLRAAGVAASLHRETLHVHAPIVAPSIDAPADGATVATDHPVLSVNDAATASGAALAYAFEVYRDAALTMPIPGASGVPETPQRTAWTVSTPLEEDARYWWRARATDGFSNSAWTSVASFRVDAHNTPPSSPRTESPREGDVVATLLPELVVVNAFDPDQEVLTYDFRVARDAAMADVVASVSGVAETAIFTRWTVPVTLDEDASYFWSARAHDPQQASPWSVPARFTVDTTNLPPFAVPLLRPAEDAEIAALTTELAAGPAVDPEGNPLTYRFEVDRVPTFDSPDRQASPEVPLTAGEAVWTPPQALADNAYAYWRAAARDAHASGPWASRRFFVNVANDAPGAPVPLAPGSGTIVATQTPTLRVQNALDADLDLLTYEFEVSLAGGGLVASVAGVPQGVAESQWTVAAPLAENGTFTWRARAYDGTVVGPWTAQVPFRVNAVDEPPTAPTLVSPAEGAVLGVPPPELVVANASSPDLLELAYDFELYAVENAGGLVLVEAAPAIPSGATQTAWSPIASIGDGNYSWRARAVDVHQAGPWMDSAHFTVASDLPPAAPTGLTALGADGSVTLSWNPGAEPDLTGYRVYRGTTAGGPYAFVAATVQPSYTDGGLVNGQAVYYVVTATDATQESPRSAEASATPHAGPVQVQVTYWPAVVDGECVKCPATLSNPVHFGPLRPVLECVVEETGVNTTTAYFGFDNGTAAVTARPVGPSNFFTPAPDDRGQPSIFARGRSPEFPGVFGVPFTGSPLTWTLDGTSATALAVDVTTACPLPPITCRRWLHATLEPPAGLDPATIDVKSLVLDGRLKADPDYHVIVDRDGDLVPELEVRFEGDKVWPKLQTGSNALGVTGSIGALEFVGAASVELAGLKARADFTPAIYSMTSRHPRVELRLRGCYRHTAVDIDSIRLNGVVPVRQLISSTNTRTIVEFDRDATIAVLPLGDRVEIVVTGLSNRQPFRAVDYIKVQP
jgi:subtilase family serine protease